MRIARSIFGVWMVGVATICADLLPTTASAADLPAQPQMGFRGDIVRLKANTVPAPEGVPNVGIRVDFVRTGSPAARMGLETGDIVVSIDSMRFTTLDGYRYALRAAGQRPSVLLIDARTGKLRRRPCDLPHRQPPENERKPKPPETYVVMIDLVGDLPKR